MSIEIILIFAALISIGGYFGYDTYKTKQEEKKAAERKAKRKAKKALEAKKQASIPVTTTNSIHQFKVNDEAAPLSDSLLALTKTTEPSSADLNGNWFDSIDESTPPTHPNKIPDIDVPFEEPSFENLFSDKPLVHTTTPGVHQPLSENPPPSIKHDDLDTDLITFNLNPSQTTTATSDEVPHSNNHDEHTDLNSVAIDHSDDLLSDLNTDRITVDEPVQDSIEFSPPITNIPAETIDLSNDFPVELDTATDDTPPARSSTHDTGTSLVIDEAPSEVNLDEIDSIIDSLDPNDFEDDTHTVGPQSIQSELNSDDLSHSNQATTEPQTKAEHDHPNEEQASPEPSTKISIINKDLSNAPPEDVLNEIVDKNATSTLISAPTSEDLLEPVVSRETPIETKDISSNNPSAFDFNAPFDEFSLDTLLAPISSPFNEAKLSRRPAKILYVDDAKVYRIKMETLLKENGCRVVLANDGIEAEAILLQGNEVFDMIISDVEMPIMSGFELFKSIQDHPPSKALPFVIITASYDHVVTSNALGCSEALIKPFTENDVETLLHKHLPEFFH